MTMLAAVESGGESLGASLALLAVRMVAGIAFLIHGWPKIRDPFAWMGARTPRVFQALAAIAELGGGLAWIIGLLTPLASLGIACTMIVAIARHVLAKRDPFVGGYELAAVYLCICLLMLSLGPGRFSLDYLLWHGGIKASRLLQWEDRVR
jgi:putative oxidoreductase